MACILLVVFGDGRDALDRMLAAAVETTLQAPQTPERALATFQPPVAEAAHTATDVAPAPADSAAQPSLSTDSPAPGANEIVTTYAVKQGDNLFRISLRFGVTVEEILAANGLTNDTFIRAGQTLAIPVTPTPPVTPLESATGEATVPVQANTPTPAPVEPSAILRTPLPADVNGVPIAEIAVIPPGTRRNIRAIFKDGQSQGNNPRAFSKVGDSTIENPFFLARFDEGPYNLGEYAHLQGVIDYYAGSYGRQGMSVKRGLHSWTVMDPTWADQRLCLANEGPIECEFRQHRPSIVLIRLGSNDAGVPAYFEQNVRQIVAYAIEKGVVPVLGTKADRIEGPDNINNDILRRIAAEFEVPLWDFDRVAGTMPGRGLDVDNVHLTTFYAHDYTSPLAMQRGHAVHNLTALVVLDAIWNELVKNTP